MKRQIFMALISLYSSAAMAAVDFDGLIETASDEQFESQQRLKGIDPQAEIRKTSARLENSEFTIRLVRVPKKKKTMVAKNLKLIRDRTNPLSKN